MELTMKMWILLGVLIALDAFNTVRLVRQGWSAGDVLKLALWGFGGSVVVCVILIALQFV